MVTAATAAAVELARLAVETAMVIGGSCDVVVAAVAGIAGTPQLDCPTAVESHLTIAANPRSQN